MPDPHEETVALLEDHPEREQTIRSLLTLDAERDTWSFDEAALDSGTFGELVSRGIVEKVDGEYRIADRAATQAALDGDARPQSDGTEPQEDGLSLDISLGSVDWTLVGSLVALVGLVVLFRTAFSWSAVFRDGHVVLMGNDAYLYRDWVEHLLRADPTLGGLPQRMATHDVLMIVTAWGLAGVLGGTANAAGMALAWYPVVAAVVVGLAVYGMATVAFDRQTGLASLAVYAVTPAAVYRTALGFGDHHAFDYVWLSITLASLVVLAGQRVDWRTVTRRRVLAAAGVVVGVVAQTFAWRAGPLLLLPIGVYLVVRCAADIAAGRSPVRSNAWLLGSLAVGSVLVLGVHALLGWAEPFRALSPALLAGGAVLVASVSEVASRRDTAPGVALGAEFVGGIALFGLAFVVFQPVQVAFSDGLRYFQTYGQSDIAETLSLFSTQNGGLIAPFLFFGFAFFFGIGALVAASVWVSRTDRPSILCLVTYGWCFVVAAAVQLRFAAQLAIPLSVFTGVAFVYIATRIDLLPEPEWLSVQGDGRPTITDTDATKTTLTLPDSRTLLNLGLLFLLVGGVGFVQAPVKTTQLAVEDATYDAAVGTDTVAEQQARSWPENYVFSQWGRNRVYNYFVSGHAESYSYARENYGAFVSSTAPESWYRTLASNSTGFVVVQPQPAITESATVQSRLWDRWGSRGNGTDGVGHYQAVYANDQRKVFQLVPGARLTGTSTPNTTVDLQTTVELDERQFQYTRRVETNRYGEYGVTVPYSGTYSVQNRTRTVSDAAVENGSTIGPYVAHYSFDDRRGDVVTDAVGGTTGTIQGAEWVDGPRGSALAFDADSNDTVLVDDSAGQLQGAEQFTICTRAKPDDSTAARQDVVNVGGFDALIAWGGQAGWEVYFRNQTGSYSLMATSDQPTGWTDVCGRYDGSTLELWIDGDLVAERPATGTVGDQGGTTSIGSFSNNDRFFDGTVDDVRIYRSALEPSQIRNLTTRDD
ncbi:LamG-like jellyroll fold domain-containing protein [Haloarcula pellucida]|uniref:LamG-like jellyroll fold domain-containing protein n=1 Tax=Haloarcula pellucida TaxID=1427151 RepID=A0A830GLK7_9EURY|nr:LamG-like jellyroll fold domain-containing protein [Halomicroarcula pellucida]MBX0348745.1 hypothetical protein [Halomicroarcula pellucida]GGN91969.1 hypothetical protein GCM10009030_15640 [Halomicroarcula pellucida]